MIAALSACLLLLSWAAHRAATPGKDVAPLVALAPKDARWLSHGVYLQGLPLHSHGRVVVVAGTGELAYGRDQLPETEQRRWFPADLQGLVAVARREAQETPGREVWCLSKDRAWKALPDQDRAAFEVMGRLPGMVAVRLRSH
jgi:hypothetical protein